ncbi:MAG: protein tyrosine phosphatase, partial [Actinomycetales bacterium]
MAPPYRITTVCLGNICRSPIAEVVLTERIHQAGLGDQVLVDSAGTGDWHVGGQADRRTIAVL